MHIVEQFKYVLNGSSFPYTCVTKIGFKIHLLHFQQYPRLGILEKR